MRRIAFVSSAWLCAWLALGCAGERLSLLELEPIDTSALESDGELLVRGTGLPLGHAGMLALDGTLYCRGRAPRAVRASIAVEAHAPDQIAVSAKRVMQALGGHGSFEGKLELSFAGKDTGVTLSGRASARFDVLDPMHEGAGEEHVHRERAAAWLARVGIVAAGDGGAHEGLMLAYALEGSAAARAGLRRGDVITSASNVRVYTLSHLSPPPRARVITARVLRPSSGKSFQIELPTEGELAPEALPIGRLALALGFFCSVLCLGSLPVLSALERLRARIALAPKSAIGLWGGDRRAAGRKRGSVLAAWLSTVGVVVVWHAPSSLLSVRSLSLYLPLVAVSVALTFMNAELSPRQRVRSALALLGRMSVMGAVLGSACALAGARSFDGLVAAQGFWPWQWGLLREPALLLAFPLYLQCAARLCASELPRAQGALARMWLLERVSTHVVFSALGAVIFWGGHQTLSPESSVLPPRLLGALLFVLKCWLLAWCVRAIRKSQLGVRDSLRGGALTFVTTLAVIALCAGSVLLKSALGDARMHELAEIWGRAGAITLVLTLMAFWLRIWRRGVIPQASGSYQVVR